MEYLISLDTTLPVGEGINEIVHTLFEAVALVILVVFVFLQNWRATLIPLVTVPVSLIGAFIFFPMLGFSINVLSLLGLVLAIGIVVDDAIVVVEAVMHHLEHGMQPKEATLKAMEEVSGPVVAIGLVLSAVFVPVGFMGGITGMLLPAVRDHDRALGAALGHQRPHPEPGALGAAAEGADGQEDAPDALLQLVQQGLRPRHRRLRQLLGHPDPQDGPQPHLHRRSSCGAIVVLARHIPAGFIPEEDQGYLLAQVNLPDASSLERTDLVMKKAEAIIKANEGVEGYNTVTGFSLVTGAYSSNQGFFFIQLKEWAHRTTPETHANGVVAALNKAFAQQIPEAAVVTFGPPAIPGLGTGAGFTMQLQDRSGGSPEFLAQQAARFIEAARKRPEIGRVSTLYRASVPQVFADVDRSKVLKVGATISDVNTTLGALLGSSYVNDFNRFGRVYKVYVQAEPEFRKDPKQLGLFFVRSAKGEMIPLDTLISTRPTSGPEFTNRFNLFRSAEIGGVPAPGYSSAQALDRPRRDGEGGPAPGDGLRVGGHVVPGEEGPGRGRGVRHRHPARLPDPGRAVRELGAALQRAARHPVRGVRRLLRPVGRPPVLGELREQRVRADRAHHADRPRREERDPDRRVREDADGPGHGSRRGGAALGQAALPADPDDGLRLHPGRRAPAHGERAPAPSRAR